MLLFKLQAFCFKILAESVMCVILRDYPAFFTQLTLFSESVII